MLASSHGYGFVTRFDTLLAQLKLKASVGALSETDLEQINPLFEAR